MPGIVRKVGATPQELRKNVSAIHVSGELSLLERKLVNVLLLNAFDKLLTERKHTIPVGILSKMLGRDDSNNVENLKRALTNIMKTVITFDLLSDSKKAAWVAAPPLSFAGISEGVCTYEYSEWLSERLANPDIYAIINVNVQRQFTGAYALALYENCVRFRRVGSTGWLSVALWRRLLGADADLYNEFKWFSAKVIKPAVSEVNQVSNILITPEYRRDGRYVKDIRFLVADNPQRSVLDAADDTDAIRESESFKRLVNLGIGERLAITWIQQEPERALQVAIYTEERARRNQITGSTGGYARTIFENGTSLEVSPIERAREELKAAATDNAKAQQEVEKVAEARASATTAAIKALTIVQKRELAAEFIASNTAVKSYRPETATFKDVVERTAFTSWLRSTIAAQLAAQ
jgi:hypothetical protein